MEAADALDFSAMFGGAKPRESLNRPRGQRCAAPAVPAETAEDMPRLVLQQFAAVPQVLFGDVAARSSATRGLMVRNEASKVQRLEVRGLETRDALVVYPATLEVPPHSEAKLSITWKPTASGVLQKKLELRWNGAGSLHADLRGTCAKPAAKKFAPPPAVRVPVKEMAASAVAAPKRSPLSPNPNRPASMSSQPFQRPRSFDTIAPSPLVPDHGATDQPEAAPDEPTEEVAAVVETANAAPLDAHAPPALGPPKRVEAKPAVEPSALVKSFAPAPAPSATKPAVPKRNPVIPGRKLQLNKAAPAAPKMDGAACGTVGTFYDSAWLEKREVGYTRWLNFMLCDNVGDNAEDGAGMDAGERQRLSLRQLEQERTEAVLRRRAVLLLRGPTLRPTLTKMEREVDGAILFVRAPLNLLADVTRRPARTRPRLPAPPPRTATRTRSHARAFTRVLGPPASHEPLTDLPRA